MTSQTPGTEKEARWGVTWVGGVLYYGSRDEAESRRRAFGSGSIVPPTQGGAS